MRSPAKSAYLRGIRDGAPFLLVIIPFAMLFGVVATEAGLSSFEALAFSVTVIAGAAQFTAVQLLSDGAPALVVLASAMAVNLRMAMYSASLSPHVLSAPLWQRLLMSYFIVDQTYIGAISAYERETKWDVRQRIAYFFGLATPICGPWYAATLLGAWLGASVPPALSLDFAIPVTFLAMLGPMLHSWPHRIAAAVSVILALLFVAMPYNLGLIVSAIGAMGAGALSEIWITRNAAEATS